VSSEEGCRALLLQRKLGAFWWWPLRGQGGLSPGRTNLPSICLIEPGRCVSACRVFAGPLTALFWGPGQGFGALAAQGSRSRDSNVRPQAAMFVVAAQAQSGGKPCCRIAATAFEVI